MKRHITDRRLWAIAVAAAAIVVVSVIALAIRGHDLRRLAEANCLAINDGRMAVREVFRLFEQSAREDAEASGTQLTEGQIEARLRFFRAVNDQLQPVDC